MKSTNPLPGMNPLLESRWPDAHTALIGFIRESLSESLPDDLRALAEEQVQVNAGGEDRHYRADVAVVEAWEGGFPPIADAGQSSGAAVAVAEPEIIQLNEPPERWVEIRDRSGHLVTVIEVLSPSNKSDEGRVAYLAKQRDYRQAGVNLVEIDLLRCGSPPLAAEMIDMLRPAHRTRYLVLATRAIWPSRREVYYCPLRERLPAIRIPLRVTDPDVPLDLQPLVDRVYRTGRYWLDARMPLPPPPLPEDDEAWMRERMREAGLAE